MLLKNLGKMEVLLILCESNSQVNDQIPTLSLRSSIN